MTEPVEWKTKSAQVSERVSEPFSLGWERRRVPLLAPSAATLVQIPSNTLWVQCVMLEEKKQQQVVTFQTAASFCPPAERSRASSASLPAGIVRTDQRQKIETHQGEVLSSVQIPSDVIGRFFRSVGISGRKHTDSTF